MWPGFDSRTRRHMWVEFVVSSRPCSEGFSPRCPVFLPPQKRTLPNSNSTWKTRTPLNEFLESSLVLRVHCKRLCNVVRFRVEREGGGGG